MSLRMSRVVLHTRGAVQYIAALALHIIQLAFVQRLFLRLFCLFVIYRCGCVQGAVRRIEAFTFSEVVLAERSLLNDGGGWDDAFGI